MRAFCLALYVAFRPFLEAFSRIFFPSSTGLVESIIILLGRDGDDDGNGGSGGILGGSSGGCSGGTSGAGGGEGGAVGGGDKCMQERGSPGLLKTTTPEGKPHW